MKTKSTKTPAGEMRYDTKRSVGADLHPSDLHRLDRRSIHVDDHRGVERTELHDDRAHRNGGSHSARIHRGDHPRRRRPRAPVDRDPYDDRWSHRTSSPSVP